VRFGYESEWETFAQENPKFLERFENLEQAIHCVAQTKLALVKSSDRILFFLCQQCIEDFCEILLLVGNGYGTGALKILRTMYEHAVTFSYLVSHEEEAKDFVDYHWIQEQKLARKIVEVFGKGAIPENKVAEINDRYAEVKEKFTIPECEKCGGTRVNHTWNSLDFVSMAQKAGIIGRLIIQAYYLPLLHSHPSIRSLNTSVKPSEPPEDGMAFDFSRNATESKIALSIANSVLVIVFDSFATHFNLPNLAAKVAVCTADIGFVWAADESSKAL
jgi:hypothetical protein